MVYLHLRLFQLLRLRRQLRFLGIEESFMQLLLHNATNSTTNHRCKYTLSSRKINQEGKALRATQQFLQFAARKL